MAYHHKEPFGRRQLAKNTETEKEEKTNELFACSKHALAKTPLRRRILYIQLITSNFNNYSN